MTMITVDTVNIGGFTFDGHARNEFAVKHPVDAIQNLQENSFRLVLNMRQKM